MQILLSFPEYLKENAEAEQLVLGSVNFLLHLRKKSGNFPSSLNMDNPSVANSTQKELIHWCHGAGGKFAKLRKHFIKFDYLKK